MQDPTSYSGWWLRLSQLLKTKLLAHLTPHMAFPRGGDFKNTAITFRIASTDSLKNSSACSFSLLLRGCSFNFVNKLFPACFNCSQKCYYVPYSLLSISNIFLWNQILILHCAFFTWNGVVSVAQERPLLPTLQNVHGALSSHQLLTPAFMGFSSLSHWPPATRFGSYSQQFRCFGALS